MKIHNLNKLLVLNQKTKTNWWNKKI